MNAQFKDEMQWNQMINLVIAGTVRCDAVFPSWKLDWHNSAQKNRLSDWSPAA
jgi:hypothetical protein